MKDKHLYSLAALSLIWFSPLLAQNIDSKPAIPKFDKDKIHNFNLTLQSQVDFPYALSNVWGYTAQGKEYALVGTQKGVSIVDVSNPVSPVTLFNVPAAESQWRELKTYKNYAYASNETGGGILIIDLSKLPQNVSFFNFTDNNRLRTAHTVWVDEKGRLYAFGYNSSGGALIYDLTKDPTKPTFLGRYDENYVHDGFARGDTLWSAEIFAGRMTVVDLKNIQSPIVKAAQETPGRFTHNLWPTKNNRYVFTTDEVAASYLASYKVDDLNNIEELDRVKINPNATSIVHNVHLVGDQFAATSYYTDGVVIFDVSRPDNMVKVGSFDTSPFEGASFKGCWGVYPYFPSGTLVATNIEGQLTILKPTYTHACWLEGSVKDAVSGTNIGEVSIQLDTMAIETTNVEGEFKTGIAEAGAYSVKLLKAGYETRTIEGVRMENGKVTRLDVVMTPLQAFSLNISTIDSATKAAIPTVQVKAVEENEIYTYQGATNENGAFQIGNFFPSTYNFLAGKWGYRTRLFKDQVIPFNFPKLDLALQVGYYDDFSFDYTWFKQTNDSINGWILFDDAVNDLPFGSNGDVEDDFGTGFYYTELYEENDTSILATPTFDLSQVTDAEISFKYQYFGFEDRFGLDDTLNVYISNGLKKIRVLTVTPGASTPKFTWNEFRFKVAPYLEASATMQLIFEAKIGNDPSYFFAAIDKFQVLGTYTPVSRKPEVSIEGLKMVVYPNPSSGNFTVDYTLPPGIQQADIQIIDQLGRVLLREKTNGIQSRLALQKNWESGIYYLQVILPDGRVGVKQLLIQ